MSSCEIQTWKNTLFYVRTANAQEGGARVDGGKEIVHAQSKPDDGCLSACILEEGAISN